MDLSTLASQYFNRFTPPGVPQNMKPGSGGYADTVLRTKAQYPFIDKLNPVMIPSTLQGGEGWPPGETGDASAPRPAGIPLNRPGIQVPAKASPGDVAGEVLHVDPYANLIRDTLMKSMSPGQNKYLQHEALDFGDDTSGMSYKDRMRNAVDSAMRGKVVGQWPASANAGMNYTPQQLQLLKSLSSYMQTGKR